MTNRSYGEACGLAHALDLVGERWALLVVRELLLGPKRFSDLDAGLAGVSPKVLSERLRQLEEVGVLRRHKLGPPTRAWVYELTARGRELEPIMVALGTWGLGSPLFDDGGHVSADSIMLALRSYFTSNDPRWQATYALHLGDDTFAVRVDGSRLRVERGYVDSPDAVVETDATAFKDLLGKRLRSADPRVTVTGDRAGASRLLAAVRPPDAAA